LLGYRKQSQVASLACESFYSQRYAKDKLHGVLKESDPCPGLVDSKILLRSTLHVSPVAMSTGDIQERSDPGPSSQAQLHSGLDGRTRLHSSRLSFMVGRSTETIPASRFLKASRRRVASKTTNMHIVCTLKWLNVLRHCPRLLPSINDRISFQGLDDVSQSFEVLASSFTLVS